VSRLPALRPSAVVAALKKAGFVEKRQKGSHVILWHEQKRRTTMVALHGWAMPRPIVKEILKQAGLTEDEFLMFLKQS
jgi:predicted RNA binding protein YcfA (HicA-like mRNA interferase family)